MGKSAVFILPNPAETSGPNTTPRILHRWFLASYARNGWFGWSPSPSSPNGEPASSYQNETQVEHPALSPVLADAVCEAVFPKATDLPPRDLLLGTVAGMAAMSIPRHGPGVKPVPREHPPERLLPGSVNVSFFDGHAQSVALESLWQLYWHRDYQSPAKRPGLK